MCQRGVPQGRHQIAPSTTGDACDARTTAWAEIDVGKLTIGLAVDADGRALVSVKVANVEADIAAALATVSDLADQVVWAVDIVGAPSALILALLARAQSPVFYASGRVVNTMSAAYTGEGKTDAKDAYVIAETLRLRRDLPIVDTVTDLTRELALLTAHHRRPDRRPGPDDQPTARCHDQRLSYPGTTIRLLLPQRRADLADRVRQPETVAPARGDPPRPNGCAAGRCETPPASPPRAAAARRSRHRTAGPGYGGDDHRRARREPSSARPARPRPRPADRCDVPSPPSRP